MKNLSFILYLISAILYFLILKEVVFTYNFFPNSTFFILASLYLIFGYTLIVNNIRWQFITYLLSLLVILFYRRSEVGFNFEFYLLDWLPYITKNKIVMFNIIGNILIFIPMGMYTKNIFIGLLFIISVELLQVFLERGMFDIVDIVLNFIGFAIGSLEVTIWRKMIKKEKTSMMILK